MFGLRCSSFFFFLSSPGFSLGCSSSSSSSSFTGFEFLGFFFFSFLLSLGSGDLGFFSFFSFLVWVSEYWKKKKVVPSDRYRAYKQYEKY